MQRVATEQLPQPGDQYSKEYMLRLIAGINRNLESIQRSAAAGNTILNGDGPPASSLGSNGDIYLDKTNTFLYGPKTNGLWGSGVSLIGP